jgi:hypothetical protein
MKTTKKEIRSKVVATKITPTLEDTINKLAKEQKISKGKLVFNAIEFYTLNIKKGGFNADQQ